MQDSCDKLVAVCKARVLQGLLGQSGEPEFDLIEPRGVRRQKYWDEALVLGQELSRRVATVRGPVVENQIESLARVAFSQSFQEVDKCSTVVPRDDFTNDFAGVDIKGRDEIRCPVTAIFELDFSGRLGPGRLVGRAPFQSLNGSLLVDADYPATHWPIDVERNDSVPLRVEFRVLAVQPVTKAMRLDVYRCKPFRDRRPRNCRDDAPMHQLIGQKLHCPRGVRRRRLTHDKRKEFMPLVYGKASRATRAWCVSEARHAVLNEPAAPLSYCLRIT